MLKKIFLTLILVFLVFGNTIYAQETDLPEPGILPTNNFYFLKNWSERIGTFFTFGEVAKAERYLELSEKRLAEANALSAAGEIELAEGCFNRYQEQLGNAFQWAERAREKGKDTEEVLGRMSEATFKHQGVLLDVYEKVPDEAKGSIERALDRGIRGHEESVEKMTEQQKQQVMENVQERVQEIEGRIEGFRERVTNQEQLQDRKPVR